MTTCVNFRSIGKYSGPVVYGTEVVLPPNGPFHAGRAFWLTGQVETGNRLGSVMMADGTGFTIGIDQHIAVYPKELAHEDFNAADDQGGAWALLAALEVAHAPVRMLWEAFTQRGWYVAPDGTLRWITGGTHKVQNRKLEHRGGDLVHGNTIRNAVTPTGGRVVKTCEKETAREWALMLHELTRDPTSRDIQVSFGVKHLCHRVRTRKLRLADHRRRVTFQQAVYGDANIEVIKLSDLGYPLDLALCVFHSYTVNAPAVAFRILEESIRSTGWTAEQDGHDRQESFARDLLHRIKTEKYGFWNKRWERTRKAAMELGCWDGELFTRKPPVGIMTP
jgi:hypothetical protein